MKLTTIIVHNNQCHKGVQARLEMNKELWQKPHPRSCLVHREAASCILTPTAWGGHTAAGSMPGMAVAASWFAHPAMPPECPGSLSSHRAQFREPPLGLRETLGASHVTCIVLCPLTILTQRIGPPLPSIPPAVTSGVVQDSCPFFASIQLLPLDP